MLITTCEVCGKPVREGLRACEGLSSCWLEVTRRDAAARPSLVIVDDPELDATDGAHPAWWRGANHAELMWRKRCEKAEAKLVEVERERDEARAPLEGLLHQRNTLSERMAKLNEALDKVADERDALRELCASESGRIAEARLWKDELGALRELERFVRGSGGRSIELIEILARLDEVRK